LFAVVMFNTLLAGTVTTVLFPRAVLPGQSAVDDVRPDQIAGALNHVGAGGRAVEVEIAGGKYVVPVLLVVM
jgi:CO dehydrogenase/acetyl-CoA synthase gamma subunit (corrinoid Fe-S protein)